MNKVCSCYLYKGLLWLYKVIELIDFKLVNSTIINVWLFLLV